MKQESGIQITPTSCIPVAHGSYAVAATTIASMRVPSIRTAAMVAATPTTRGVVFWWRDNRNQLIK